MSLVTIITHSTPQSDVFRYVNVRQKFQDAVTMTGALVLEKLMNGLYADNEHAELDIVHNDDEDREYKQTFVRVIHNETGEEYEAYIVTETEVR